MKDLAIKFYTIEATVGTTNLGISKNFDKIIKQLLELAKAEQNVILYKIVNA